MNQKVKITETLIKIVICVKNINKKIKPRNISHLLFKLTIDDP